MGPLRRDKNILSFWIRTLRTLVRNNAYAQFDILQYFTIIFKNKPKIPVLNSDVQCFRKAAN